MRPITIYPDQYPFLLRQIAKLPASLDVIGTIPDDSNKFLCVVGSRTHSSYGLDVCRRLLLGLKVYPIVIVSGLAVGIDSLAHQTALDIGLKTVAFPGSGLADSVLYPSSRRSLAKSIVDHGGALVSEFKIDQMGDIWTFPKRNRLMAGISHATLVIEARHDSGSLGTARNASEFGRDVLVVPGSIFSDLSEGNNRLLREGATAVASSEDILESLGFEMIENLSGEKRTRRDYSQLNLTDKQREIISLLETNPLSSSQLLEMTNSSPIHLNILLSEMELANIIIQNAGIYRLK